MMDIPKSWTFNTSEVASNFDSHVREQLPWYDVVTSMVFILAQHFLPGNAVAYDVGCSTGNLGKKLSEIIKARNIKWVGIDNAESMKEHYLAPGALEICDALDYDFQPFDLAVCFLSMMFMDYSRRGAWLEKMVKLMKPGGAIIIVDREEPDAGVISTAFQRAIWEGKITQGADPKKIIEKEISLCGIQRPLPAGFLKDYHAKEFFRLGLFAGYIIIKQ